MMRKIRQPCLLLFLFVAVKCHLNIIDEATEIRFERYLQTRVSRIHRANDASHIWLPIARDLYLNLRAHRSSSSCREQLDANGESSTCRDFAGAFDGHFSDRFLVNLDAMIQIVEKKYLSMLKQIDSNQKAQSRIPKIVWQTWKNTSLPRVLLLERQRMIG